MVTPATMDCEIVITRNGSMAVRDRVSGEVMHPMGAETEANEVYVNPSRLEARLRGGGMPLVLLDIGLGAGSNAIAAWKVSESLPTSARGLEIVSFDNDLGALLLALEPGNAERFGFTRAPADAQAAATALVRDGRFETQRTNWRLEPGDLLLALARQPDASADIVFWDMFSASVNPPLWSISTFAELRRVCRDGATVHTYSASTSTRSALLLGGFAVGVGVPTGKRDQTTAAAVNIQDLVRPLDARWLERLERSSAPFPAEVISDPDARRDALAQVRQLPQFRGR